MKSSKTRVLISFGMASICCHAAEVLETLKTRDGREYFKVEILENDAVGLKIRHDAGTARIPFQKLPDEIRSRYDFDPKEAAAKKAEESEMQMAHERRQEQSVAIEKPKTLVKPKAAEASEADGLDAGLEAPSGEIDAGKLESYIVNLRGKIKIATLEVKNLREDANLEGRKTRSRITGYDRYGTAVSTMVPDKNAAVRARRLEAKAEAKTAQIRRAEVLLAKAENEYAGISGKVIPEQTE